MSEAVYIGIDIGGTRSVAEAVAGDERYRAHGPGANLNRTSVERVAAVLSELVGEALQAFPRASHVYACAGVAGAGRPDASKRLSDRWHGLLPAHVEADVCVEHDGVVALEGAFAGESGAILIAGTGSLALGRTASGALVRAGGWGYLLGDEGSGYAVGRAAIRALAEATDGGPTSALTTRIAMHLGMRTRDDLVRLVYDERLPFENIAPLVVEAASAGEPQACELLEREAAILVRQIELLTTPQDPVEPRVALVGGLANAPVYADVLRRSIDALAGDWYVTDAREAPEQGALRLARKRGDDPV